jgi:hypothetical protein
MHREKRGEKRPARQPASPAVSFGSPLQTRAASEKTVRSPHREIERLLRTIIAQPRHDSDDNDDGDHTGTPQQPRQKSRKVDTPPAAATAAAGTGAEAGCPSEAAQDGKAAQAKTLYLAQMRATLASKANEQEQVLRTDDPGRFLSADSLERDIGVLEADISAAEALPASGVQITKEMVKQHRRAAVGGAGRKAVGQPMVDAMSQKLPWASAAEINPPWLGSATEAGCSEALHCTSHWTRSGTLSLGRAASVARGHRWFYVVDTNVPELSGPQQVSTGFTGRFVRNRDQSTRPKQIRGTRTKQSKHGLCNFGQLRCDLLWGETGVGVPDICDHGHALKPRSELQKWDETAWRQSEAAEAHLCRTCYCYQQNDGLDHASATQNYVVVGLLRKHPRFIALKARYQFIDLKEKSTFVEGFSTRYPNGVWKDQLIEDLHIENGSHVIGLGAHKGESFVSAGARERAEMGLTLDAAGLYAS